jgi:hypothetical protein
MENCKRTHGRRDQQHGGFICGLAIALAQNTNNPMMSGNTTNPVLERKYYAVSPGSQVPISPALPSALLAPTIGRNAARVGAPPADQAAPFWQAARAQTATFLERSRDITSAKNTRIDDGGRRDPVVCRQRYINHGNAFP